MHFGFVKFMHFVLLSILPTQGTRQNAGSSPHRNTISSNVYQSLTSCLPNRFLWAPVSTAWLHFPRSPAVRCAQKNKSWSGECGRNDECQQLTWPVTTFHIIGHAPFHPASASWMQRVQQRILKSLPWAEPLMDSAASQDHQLSHSLHPYVKLCSAFDWTKPGMLGVIVSSSYSTQKVNRLSRCNIKSPIFPDQARLYRLGTWGGSKPIFDYPQTTFFSLVQV